ncbi:MAG TPA: adenylate/guanylate cyclase domain-containing protein [Thermohalobaculum sp.]|nr:adenylate/guanylate cyclase domain-containing protein [Thermohalobaculum sp.]
MSRGRGQALGPVSVLLTAVLALGFAGWRVAELDPRTGAAEARLLDLRFRLAPARAPPAGVAIVALDEAAVAAAPGLAARRQLLARALERIGDAAPAAVALDLLLVEESAADARLATVMARIPRLALAAAALEEATDVPVPAPEQEAAIARSVIPVVRARPQSALPSAEAALLPLPRFASPATLGHVNIVRDADRVARMLPLAVGVGEGRWLPALPLVAVALAQGAGAAALALDADRGVLLGGRLVPTDRAGRIVLDHYGAEGTIDTVGLAEVAAGEVPAARLAGRIVFVGSTAASMRDTFATPLGPDVPGVEVLATAAANILEGRTVRRDAEAALLTAALALVAGIAALGAGALRDRRLSAAALLAVAALTGAVLLAGFGAWRLWLDAVAILLSLAAGGAIGGFFRFRSERALSDALSQERRNLARYVSPALADVLASARSPDFDRRRQDAAVLFVDVAGYTALVESLDPVEVAGFLSRLHGFFEEAAERHGGVVVDFLGDGAMLVFGLPQPAPDDAARALATAGTLAAPPEGLTPGGGPLALRVSVHFGPIAVAVLGGRRHGQLSITGDTVNLASRLQESAKAAGAAVVTTRETLVAARLDPETAPGWAFVGADPTRGRRQPVQIYRAAPVTADAG